MVMYHLCQWLVGGRAWKAKDHHEDRAEISMAIRYRMVTYHLLDCDIKVRRDHLAQIHHTAREVEVEEAMVHHREDTVHPEAGMGLLEVATGQEVALEAAHHLLAGMAEVEADTVGHHQACEVLLHPDKAHHQRTRTICITVRQW